MQHVVAAGQDTRTTTPTDSHPTETLRLMVGTAREHNEFNTTTWPPKSPSRQEGLLRTANIQIKSSTLPDNGAVPSVVRRSPRNFGDFPDWSLFMARRNLLSVNKMIADAGLAGRPEHGPTVELARESARRLDAAAPGEATAALLDAYRRALGDLRRAALEVVPESGFSGVEKGSTAVEESMEAMGDMELFRRLRAVLNPAHSRYPEAGSWSPEYASALEAESDRRYVLHFGHPRPPDA